MFSLELLRGRYGGYERLSPDRSSSRGAEPNPSEAASGLCWPYAWPRIVVGGKRILRSTALDFDSHEVCRQRAFGPTRQLVPSGGVAAFADLVADFPTTDCYLKADNGLTLPSWAAEAGLHGTFAVRVEQRVRKISLKGLGKRAATLQLHAYELLALTNARCRSMWQAHW